MHVSAEDNRLYAGPAVDQTPKRGSGKKRKLPANENVVASSPKKKLTKTAAACSRLDNTLLLERKIQQLEKQFRPFDVYTTGLKNQLILSSPSMNDTSIISYDSKGPVQELNCEAKNKTDGSLIECRHLAYAFATGGFGLKTNVIQGESKEPGSKFNTVASIDNIQNNAAIKTVSLR